ncbi:hypothetical protein V8E36_006697 [Tilletia maclaganii]
MLVFHYAPRSTQTLLNLGSQSHWHLAQIAENAKSDANALMQDSKRVKVLLFDNIDLYLRVGERITASNRLVNLTSRTMLRLPAAFDAANVSADKLKPLRVGEPAFFERAVRVQVAKELLEVLKERVKRTPGKRAHTDWQPAQAFRLMQRLVSTLTQAHAIDELNPSRWEAVPLLLLEENEGSVSGTLAVLSETASDLGVVEPARPASSPADAQSSSAEDPYAARRRYDVLPAGHTVLVAGDLKTHRNIAAALEARQEYPNEAEKLDWYHSVPGPWHLHLNWVWAIFRLHFSTDKVGYKASLERVRDALRRGKAALREDEPSYNEAWLLIKQTFSGRIRLRMHNSVLQQRRRDLTKWMPQSDEDVGELLDEVTKVINASSVASAVQNNDTTGAHARLFLRDAALAMELDDACRRGDLGRLLAVTKFLALGFAGAGKHLYAEACLDDIWASRVLDKDAHGTPLDAAPWRTLTAARLMNRSGKPESFFGVDLHQEHINRELRVDLSHGVDTAVNRLRTIYSSSAEVARAARERHGELLGSASSRRRRRQAQGIKDVERVRQLAELDSLFVLKQSALPSDDPPSIDLGLEPLRARDLLQGRLIACPTSDSQTHGYIALSRGGLSRWQEKASDEERQEALLADGVAPDPSSLDPDEDLSLADQSSQLEDRASSVRRHAWARRSEGSGPARHRRLVTG